MKKDIQLSINTIVSGAELVAKNLLRNHPEISGEKFHYMNAKIFAINGIKILVSYDTPVAMVREGIGYDFMRKNFFRKKATVSYPYEYEWVNYSNTTSRQISRFFSDYAEKYYTYREV